MNFLRVYIFGLLILLSGSFLLLHGMAQQGVQRGLQPMWWQLLTSARLAALNRKNQYYTLLYQRKEKEENQISHKQSWGDWFKSWITKPSMRPLEKYAPTAITSARYRESDSTQSE